MKKCEMETVDRSPTGGARAHRCQFKAEIAINGKLLCVRHARVEALAAAIKNGSAKAIAQLPKHAQGRTSGDKAP